MTELDHIDMCIRITELILKKHEERYHNAAQYGSEKQRISCHRRCKQDKYQLRSLMQARNRMKGGIKE